MYGWVGIENEGIWTLRNACGALSIQDRIVLGRQPGVFPQVCLPLQEPLGICDVNMHEPVWKPAIPHTSTDERPTTKQSTIHWMIYMHLHTGIRAGDDCMTCVVQTSSMAFVDATCQLFHICTVRIEEPLLTRCDTCEELSITHDGHDLLYQTDRDRTPALPIGWLIEPVAVLFAAMCMRYIHICMLVWATEG